MTKTGTILSILLSFAVLFISCEEEDTAKIDFEYVLTGESPTAILQLTNTSEVEGSFKWQFSEGANVESSDEVNPQITIDKVGEFTISLVHTADGNEKTLSKTIDITGINGISIYDDVIISERWHEEEHGFLFSSKTGEVYNLYRLSSNKGEIIDMFIGYYLESDIKIYSPDRIGMFTIPSPQETFFYTNEENAISATDFEKIGIDHFNTELDYSEDYHFIIEFDELPKIFGFKTSRGTYGLVKIQEVFPEYLLMDVKVQKYLLE